MKTSFSLLKEMLIIVAIAILGVIAAIIVFLGLGLGLTALFAPVMYLFKYLFL